MKKIAAVTLAAFCAALLLTPARAGELVEREFTLDESVTTGLHNSQELLGFQEQVSIAQEIVKEAGSQIYPKIDFNLSMSKFNNNFPTVLAPSFNSVYLPAQNIDTFYSTRFSLWQYLYANGRYSTNVRLAETNLSQARSQSDISKNRVTLDVKRSFYACLALRDKIKAYEAALAAAKGPAETAPLNLGLIKLRHDFDKQKLRHLKALGLELNTSIAVIGELVVPQEEYDLNKCLAMAKNYRPELRQTQFQETIDGLRVNMSLAERYPTVTLGANYERVGEKISSDMTNWNATINVNLPVFDGWASWSRIRQRKFQAREGKIRRAGIEDAISAEVREAFLDYTFWKERAAAQGNAQGRQAKLDDELSRLDTLEQALSSQASLEWAIGKIFFK